MRHVVVFAHPRSGGLIREAAGTSVDELEQWGRRVEVHDPTVVLPRTKPSRPFKRRIDIAKA